MSPERTPSASSTGASEPNQCDGCRRGLPLVNGVHRYEWGAGYDLIGCTANRYASEPPPLMSGEVVVVPREELKVFKQRLIRITSRTGKGDDSHEAHAMLDRWLSEEEPVLCRCPHFDGGAGKIVFCGNEAMATEGEVCKKCDSGHMVPVASTEERAENLAQSSYDEQLIRCGLSDRNRWLESEVARLASELSALREELAGARKDTERLDWLDKERNDFEDNNGTAWATWEAVAEPPLPSVREAIDAALRAQLHDAGLPE